jgi:hypothetical protein
MAVRPGPWLGAAAQPGGPPAGGGDRGRRARAPRGPTTGPPCRAGRLSGRAGLGPRMSAHTAGPQPQDRRRPHSGGMGVPRLGAVRAEAARVLARVRGHRHSDNTSPWGREVPCDAERSHGRGGTLPQVLAARRHPVMRRRQAGATPIAAACRRFAAQPAFARELIGTQREN